MLVALSASVCGAGAAAAGMASLPEMVGSRAVGFHTLERYSDGYWSRPALVLARSAREWNTAMARLEAEGAFLVLPGPAAPSVDWTRHVVVLVAAGEGAYGAVEVQRVMRNGRRLVVRVAVEPAGYLYGVHTPYHLVAVDRALLRTVGRVEAEYVSPDVPVPPMSVDVTGETDEDSGMPTETAASWAGVKALYR
jgi:hypothetical protein